MTRRHPLYIVDAFTRVPFRGNPAAVCLLRHDHPTEVLQDVAAELNLSETAFVQADGGDVFAADRFRLRWFTPTVEVLLCGHATLATAKVLYDELGLSAPTLTFDTLSGPLVARASGSGVAIDFAGHVPVPVSEPPGLRQALGGVAVEETLAASKVRLLLVRVGSPAEVSAVHPEPGQLLGSLPEYDVVVVTAPGSGDHDFVSRCFAPRLGIPEDPVTGMAHTVLGPYWARKTGRTSLRAFQASRRGGELGVEVLGTGQVRLTGESRIVVRAYLDLAP